MESGVLVLWDAPDIVRSGAVASHEVSLLHLFAIGAIDRVLDRAIDLANVGVKSTLAQIILNPPDPSRPLALADRGHVSRIFIVPVQFSERVVVEQLFGHSLASTGDFVVSNAVSYDDLVTPQLRAARLDEEIR